jgi:outer membrane receptor for ferric coprogen and ferric-rhodotorulic acid
MLLSPWYQITKKLKVSGNVKEAKKRNLDSKISYRARRGWIRHFRFKPPHCTTKAVI